MDRAVLPVDVCIATIDRPHDLAVTLACWQQVTALPQQVIVVDASRDRSSADVCGRDWSPLRVTHQQAQVPGAAAQRNQGALLAEAEFILFCDDDIRFPPTAFLRLYQAFAGDHNARIGGVAAVLDDLPSRPPSLPVWLYYRAQAGYRHPDFGAKVFGPAINRYPLASTAPTLMPSEWLNAGFVMYRRDVFMAIRFPEFPGYSFGEDLALSLVVRRRHDLLFATGARYIHLESPGAHKADGRALAEMQVRHRWFIAGTLLGLPEPAKSLKFLLSLCFESCNLLRLRPVAWQRSILGGWAAWWDLAVRRRKDYLSTLDWPP